jgi:peptidyl-prolyl cis-trans isomerase SurA
MKNFQKKIVVFIVLCSAITISWQADGPLIDRIIGVVGNQIVKESDVQDAFQTYKNENLQLTDSLRGAIFDQLMFKKLLVSQAIHDSLDVTEAEVTGETDRRMRIFLGQFKTEKDFETFYGKTVDAFKFENA